MAFDIEKAQEERREKRGRKEQEPEGFKFDVLMWTRKRGNFSREVKVSTNEPKIAKQIALDREKVKGYCEVTVVPLPFDRSA